MIIACHPTKRAGDDDLLPGGGGSILNEVDGNFVLTKQATGYVELAWQGKLRGQDFDPIPFRMESLSSPDVVDITGAQIAIPVMRPVTEQDVEERKALIAKTDAALLKAMYDSANGSMKDWADACGMKKRAVQTALDNMAKDKPKLVALQLHKWSLTKAGKDAVIEHFNLQESAVRRTRPTSRRTAGTKRGTTTVREAAKVQ